MNCFGIAYLFKFYELMRFIVMNPFTKVIWQKHTFMRGKCCPCFIDTSQTMVSGS